MPDDRSDPVSRRPLSERDGVDLIAVERRRQVEQEGWTPEHDDKHHDDALVLRLRELVKASALIAAEIDRLQRRGDG